MRRLIFTLFSLTLTLSVFSQDTKKAKKQGPWKQGGSISLVGGQGGSRNWAAGSERFSFSFAATLNLHANRSWGGAEKKTNLWENSANISYAMVNASSLGIRKQDDKFDIYSKYGYLLSGKQRKKEWRAGLVANLRTQLTPSWDYEGEKTVIGRFFAPAYLTLGPGFNFKACEGLDIFMSPVVARWVIATNQPYSFKYQGGIKPDGSNEVTLASKYGVDPARQVRFEAGPYVSAQYKKGLVKNVYLTGRLDAFSNVGDGEPTNIDIFWMNTVGMKVNNWLQVTYNFDIIYDDNVEMFGPLKSSPATQLRSMLGVGVMAKF